MAVFRTGNTGGSTGPHLDFRVYNPQTRGYEDPSQYLSYLTVGEGKTPFNYEVTSGRGMRVHPITGKNTMHDGIDYATPAGTALNVNGKHLSTWEDKTGGIMSQYGIQTKDGNRELLLLHGSRDNAITGTGAVDKYDLTDTPGSTADLKTDGPQVQAKERAVAYSEMSKATMDAEYDKLRASDSAKAADEGMKMHKAFFNKP